MTFCRFKHIISDMKKSANLIKIVFTGIVILLSSQCFAQSSTKSDTKVSSFQYMKKLNSVFDFVEQNYVDELDPKVLLKKFCP